MPQRSTDRFVFDGLLNCKYVWTAELIGNTVGANCVRPFENARYQRNFIVGNAVLSVPLDYAPFSVKSVGFGVPDLDRCDYLH